MAEACQFRNSFYNSNHSANGPFGIGLTSFTISQTSDQAQEYTCRLPSFRMGGSYSQTDLESRFGISMPSTTNATTDETRIIAETRAPLIRTARTMDAASEGVRGSIRIAPTHKYPDYENVSHRTDSFVYSDWTQTQEINPDLLIRAGFYYTGSCGRIQCFSCGLALSGLQENDDPWEEHILYTRECRFLRETKGEAYVRETKERLMNERFPDGPPDDFYPEVHATPVETPFNLVAPPMTTGQIRNMLGGSNAQSANNHVTMSTVDSETDDDEKTDEQLLEENHRLKDRMLCKVCGTSICTHILQPCGHLACCENCVHQQAFCPLCQADVRKRTRVFMC